MAAARVIRRIVAFVSVGLVAGVGLWLVPGGDPAGDSVSLERGVTPLVIDEIGLIAVRSDDDVTVFRGFDRRGEPVEWCAASGVFTTNRGGSVYGLDGVKLGGPAPSGLDRVSVVADGTDSFRVDPGGVLEPLLLPGASVDELPALPSSIVTQGWLNRFGGQASYCPAIDEIG